MSDMNIRLSQIKIDHDWNSRGKFDILSIQELAQNLKEEGQLQPALVVKEGKKYRLISGHRRYEALKYNKAKTIWCKVLETSNEAKYRKINIDENLHRSGIKPSREAFSVADLRTKGLTQEQIAKTLCKSTPWVRTRLRISELPEDIQNKIDVGMLKISDVGKIHKVFEYTEKTGKTNPLTKLIQSILNAREKPEKKEKKPSLGFHRRKKEEVYDQLTRLEHKKQATLVLQWVAGLITTEDFEKKLK